MLNHRTVGILGIAGASHIEQSHGHLKIAAAALGCFRITRDESTVSIDCVGITAKAYLRLGDFEQSVGHENRRRKIALEIAQGAKFAFIIAHIALHTGFVERSVVAGRGISAVCLCKVYGSTCEVGLSTGNIAETVEGVGSRGGIAHRLRSLGEICRGTRSIASFI